MHLHSPPFRSRFLSLVNVSLLSSSLSSTVLHSIHWIALSSASTTENSRSGNGTLADKYRNLGSLQTEHADLITYFEGMQAECNRLQAENDNIQALYDQLQRYYEEVQAFITAVTVERDLIETQLQDLDVSSAQRQTEHEELQTRNIASLPNKTSFNKDMKTCKPSQTNIKGYIKPFIQPTSTWLLKETVSELRKFNLTAQLPWTRLCREIWSCKKCRDSWKYMGNTQKGRSECRSKLRLYAWRTLFWIYSDWSIHRRWTNDHHLWLIVLIVKFYFLMLISFFHLKIMSKLGTYIIIRKISLVS